MKRGDFSLFWKTHFFFIIILLRYKSKISSVVRIFHGFRLFCNVMGKIKYILNKNRIRSFGITIQLNRYICEKFETIIHDYSYEVLLTIIISETIICNMCRMMYGKNQASRRNFSQGETKENDI